MKNYLEPAGEGLRLESVGNGCFHAVLKSESLFYVWPYPGVGFKFGATRIGDRLCVAKAKTKKEMLEKLTLILP